MIRCWRFALNFPCSVVFGSSSSLVRCGGSSVGLVLRAAAATRVPPGQTVSWTQALLLLLLPPPPRGPARCGADGGLG